MEETFSSHEDDEMTTLDRLSFLQASSNSNSAPITARKRCDETMDAIRSLILRERLQPKDMLPTEPMLCNLIGASRSSVREAIRKLEALNIVEVKQGKGMFVGSLSLDPMVETLAFRSLISINKNFEDLSDVVEMRKFLDLGCADKVVESLKGTQQPELEALSEIMTKEAHAGKTFLEQDIAFHTGILRAVNNTIAEQFVRCLWLVHMAVLPQLGLEVSDELEKTARAHELMLKTAIAGDADGYRQAVNDHYEPIQSILLNRLQRN